MDDNHRAMPGHDPKDPVPEAQDPWGRLPVRVYKDPAKAKTKAPAPVPAEAPLAQKKPPVAPQRSAGAARPTRRVRLREAIAKRDGWACCWCGCALDSDSATLEHVIPRSHGGTNAQRNLRLACQECNAYRSNKVHWTPPSAAQEVPLNPYGHVDGSGRGLEDGECIYCGSSGTLTLEPCPTRLIRALKDAQERLGRWEKWLQLIQDKSQRTGGAEHLASMAKKALTGEDPP